VNTDIFRHLDYIYAVYKEQSFSKAAKRLYISQSSLSLTVLRDEGKMGSRIFDRSKVPIRLTEFGKLYIKAAEEIMSLTRNLENYAYEINHLKRGHLSIGSGNFLAIHLVAPAISEFKEKYPNVSVNLLENRTLDLIPELNNGIIDMLVTNGVPHVPNLRRTPLFTEHLLLCVPKRFFDIPPFPHLLIDYQMLKKKQYEFTEGVPLKEFERIPFIGLRPGNDTRLRMDRLFEEARIHPALLLELDQSSTVFSMSSAGIGACIVSDAIVRLMGGKQRMLYYPLTGEVTQRDVALYQKEQDYVSKIQHEFETILKKYKI